MNNNAYGSSQKYIKVLDYLLDAINLNGIEKYSIDYIKILDAISIETKINNKEIYLVAWDINKDANIVSIKITENGKQIYNNIDTIFNLNLQKYLI